MKNDSETARQVMDALRLAQHEPPQKALPILNALVGHVRGDPQLSPEVEETRSSAFLAICQVGKALHSGQPADGLWPAAIRATERWMSLVG